MTTQKTFPVSKEYILKQYRTACPPWKAKIEAKFPEIFKTGGTTLKIGDRVNSPFFKQDMIIAQVDTGMVTLVSLQDGNRWHAPIKVCSVSKITHEEFADMIGERYYSGISEVEVNGVLIKLPKIHQGLIMVDEEFILEAHEAADYKLSAEIKELFPDIFGKRYIKLIDSKDISGKLSLSLTHSYSADNKAVFIIGRGVAPTIAHKDSCILVPKDKVSEVEVLDVDGYWVVSFVAK